MKVFYALTAHKENDERIADQQCSLLKESRIEVSVRSTLSCTDDMNGKEKVECMKGYIISFRPRIVVCDTPLSVFAAYKAKNKKMPIRILYDITEWYPSKKNLKNTNGVRKWIRAAVMVSMFISALVLSDAFVYGEFYKSLFPRFFFWKKRFLFPYYPFENKVKRYPINQNLKNELNLYYSGKRTAEKGYFRVLSIAKRLAELYPQTRVSLTVVSADAYKEWERLPSNMCIRNIEWQTYAGFCETVGAYDLYFDLRNSDFENSHCLPIKLFYYLSAGRPSIYSDLKAIRKEFANFGQIGGLFSPDDEDAIVSFVVHYMDNPELYRKHCQNSLNLCDEKFKWKEVKSEFLKFMHYGV